MANEITYSTSLSATKGYLSVTKKSGTLRADLSLGRHVDTVQAIGTAYEQVVIPADVSSAGMAFFQNLDATNYVEVGVVVSATFYPLVKLKFGEVAQFRLATTTFYARANTASVDLAVFMLAD